MIFTAYDVALTGSAGILIGYLIGNRLAIDRDRRAEWNAIVMPFYARLLDIKKNPVLDLQGGWENAFEIICLKLPCVKKRGFREAISAYRESKGADNQNPYDPQIGGPAGGHPYKDIDSIAKACDTLLKYLKPIK